MDTGEASALHIQSGSHETEHLLGDQDLCVISFTPKMVDGLQWLQCSVITLCLCNYIIPDLLCYANVIMLR